MNRKSYLSLFFFIGISFSQTHFTIPQNVWRISIQQEIATGNWKGNDGRNGWTDFSYQLDTSKYIINQQWKNNINTRSFLVEYGITNKSNIVIKVPIIKKFDQSHTWNSASAKIDSLMQKYYPTNRSNSGLGDITIGMNLLFVGNPAWRGGKKKYSIYGGLDMIIPFGEPLMKFNSKDVDKNGVPYQFKQLPIGKGLSGWRLRTFGEFYRKFKGRLINVNWKAHASVFNRDIVNPPISFLSINQLISADSLSRSLGNVLFEQGMQLYGSLSGQIELLPRKIFFLVAMDYMISGRDKYFSNNDSWDKWMVKRENYDTKQFLSSQLIKFNIVNHDPFDRIGPLPFEIEIGARWFVPLLSKNTFGYTSSWIRFSTYLQAW
jgi:hypothetical protein|tara:strand:- start:1548 stop:2678 length:1131 start_codon:yes stop_codon:yes gene_type:complete